MSCLDFLYFPGHDDVSLEPMSPFEPRSYDDKETILTVPDDSATEEEKKQIEKDNAKEKIKVARENEEGKRRVQKENEDEARRMKKEYDEEKRRVAKENQKIRQLNQLVKNENNGVTVALILSTLSWIAQYYCGKAIVTLVHKLEFGSHWVRWVAIYMLFAGVPTVICNSAIAHVFKSVNVKTHILFYLSHANAMLYIYVLYFIWGTAKSLVCVLGEQIPPIERNSLLPLKKRDLTPRDEKLVKEFIQYQADNS
jgi:cation transport ATPase